MYTCTYSKKKNRRNKWVHYINGVPIPHTHPMYPALSEFILRTKNKVITMEPMSIQTTINAYTIPVDSLKE